MELQIARDEVKKIISGNCEKYAKVAVSPEGQFKYPTGRKGLEALNYENVLTGKGFPGLAAESRI